MLPTRDHAAADLAGCRRDGAGGHRRRAAGRRRRARMSRHPDPSTVVADDLTGLRGVRVPPAADGVVAGRRLGDDRRGRHRPAGEPRRGAGDRPAHGLRRRRTAGARRRHRPRRRPRRPRSSSRSPGCSSARRAPVIRVTATGAPVQAALQASITRTLAARRGRPGRRDRRYPSVVADRAGRDGDPEPRCRGRIGCRDRRADPVARVPTRPRRSRSSAVGARAAACDADRPCRWPPAFRPRSSSADWRPGSTRSTSTPTRPLLAAVWQTTGFGEGADFAWYTRRAARRGAEPVRDAARPDAGAHGRQPRPTRRSTVAVDAVDGSFATEVTVAPGESASVRLASRAACIWLDAGPRSAGYPTRRCSGAHRLTARCARSLPGVARSGCPRRHRHARRSTRCARVAPTRVRSTGSAPDRGPTGRGRGTPRPRGTRCPRP